MIIRVLSLALLLFAGSVPLFPHPGIGVVMDSKGNIYYTDLKHVWKITPDGTKSIVVKNVHTHELSIDPDDNLFGEHLWYEGERTDKWGHRVWRRSPDGTITTIIAARQGFREDFGDFFFVRDRDGNMYWADRKDTTAILKRAPDGAVTSLAKAKFRDVRWMTVTLEGIVYLIDLHDLVCITPEGKIRTVARNLADRPRSFGIFSDRHAVMGLWTDRDGNVYTAVPADRLVRRIRPDGRMDVVARSKFPWSPTGGIVAPNGDMILLEYAAGTKARVRRVQVDG